MGSKKILLKNKKNNYKLGFTLVEVLTVLVIIGIILAITIPNVSKLMHNENDKKLSALISSALKASNVYIDTYKKSFVDTYDKYNFKYESLLTTNLVKEEDIHCTGTMQATRKKNNNYTYNAYLMCKDKKGNVIYDNTSDLPEGGVSIFGKFLIDYVVRINNQSGEYYNHQYTKENVYNEYTAYDLERPGTSAGISKFMYSYNNKDWIDLNADSNSGVGSFTLTNTYVGNIYFKAYDLVGNESETINYQVKIDKIAPSGTVSIQSTDNRYNSLNVKVNLSATDNEKGSGVSKMCIQESSDVNSCSWENYKTSKNMMLSGSLDGKSRTLYAWYKDSVGNISNISDESAKASYTTYKEGTEVIYPNGFGACSVSCGGGLKTNEAVDKYTNKKIPEKNKYESCNNQGCCTSTYISSYGTCSKTCGGGVKQVYRKSNYNNQNCTISNEKVTCNTQSCIPLATDKLIASSNMVIDDCNNSYRYSGLNADNYIRFGSSKDLWRAIGVFNVENDKGIIERRVKLMSTYPYGGNWNPLNSQYKNNCFEQSDILRDIKYNYDNKVEEKYKGMVEPAVWYVGAENCIATEDIRNWCLKERSSNVGCGSPTYTGEVATIHLSDFGYATTPNMWKVKYDGYYLTDINGVKTYTEDYGIRFKDNWMRETGWSMNVKAYSNAIFIVKRTTSGNGAHITTHSANSVKGNASFSYTTLYLKASIKITSGTGTKEDPYILSE